MAEATGWEVVESVFAYVGGILGIVLGFQKLYEVSKDKPELQLHGHPNYRRLETNESAEIGLVQVVPERGGRNEVTLEITIANKGTKPIEVTGVAIYCPSDEIYWKVTPPAVPCTIAPYSRLKVNLQPGWLQYYEATGIAACDALGRLHFMPPEAFGRLRKLASEMPVDEREGLDRFDGQVKRGFIARHDVERVNIDTAIKRRNKWRLLRG